MLDTGILGSRISMSGTRLSMTSEHDSLPLSTHQRGGGSIDLTSSGGRRNSGIYRSAAGGTGEVLFDTFAFPDAEERATGLGQLDEEEDESEMGGESRRLVGGRSERHPALSSGVVRGETSR